MHDNTENHQSKLRCSHTQNKLSGKWTSPVYDFEGEKTIRVYGDFKTEFKSSKTTWQGVAPTGSHAIHWNNLNIKQTWNDVFQPLKAGQIRSVLRYKTIDTWQEVRFFEILCAEIKTRYVQVVIHITDPTPDARLSIYPLNMNAYTWR